MVEACRLRRDERYEACNDVASRLFVTPKGRKQ